MTKNFAYEVICADDKGWGACADGLWSADYVDRASRIFATAAEARALCEEFLGAGCWTVTDDDTGESEDQTPDFRVERISVYEACWLDEREQDVADQLVEIHGGAIEFRAMPVHVAKFLMTKFGASSDDWSRLSASLQGASSATHTAAFASAAMSNRARQIADMLAQRAA